MEKTVKWCLPLAELGVGLMLVDWLGAGTKRRMRHLAGMWAWVGLLAYLVAVIDLGVDWIPTPGGVATVAVLLWVQKKSGTGWKAPHAWLALPLVIAMAWQFAGRESDWARRGWAPVAKFAHDMVRPGDLPYLTAVALWWMLSNAGWRSRLRWKTARAGLLFLLLVTIMGMQVWRIILGINT